MRPLGGAHGLIALAGLLTSVALGACGSSGSGGPASDGGRVDGGRVDGGRVDGGRLDGGRLDGGTAQDGGSVPDGGPEVDGGTSADGGSASMVGQGCQDDPQCGTDGACITELPGGYCTVDCTSVDCPEGSICFSLGTSGVSACFKSCQDNNDCRVSEGYFCDADNSCYADPVEPDGGVVIVPDGGVVIVPDGGVAPDGGVVTPDGGIVTPDGGTSAGGEVGAACLNDQQCAGDGFCETTLPGGYCFVDCTLDPCPSGSTCFEVNAGGDAVCFKSCTSSAECRVSEGYICDADDTCFTSPAPADGGTTPADGGPPTDAGTTPADAGTTPVDAGTNRAVGSACTADAQCAGGINAFCATELPGGYCFVDCTIDPCPSGSQCFQVDLDGNALCFDSCTSSTQCRQSEGYVCDADNTCFPPPASADGGTSPADGGALRAVGAACTANAQCAGGTCATDFPGGYCTKLNCTASPCPSGSACFETLSGSACFKTCVIDNDCRVAEGYICDFDDTCYPA